MSQESYSLGILKPQWKAFRLFIEKNKKHRSHMNPIEYKVKIKKIEKVLCQHTEQN